MSNARLSKPIRIASLIASGGLILQTGPCVADTLGPAAQTVLLTYLYDTFQGIFYNVLNV